MDKLAKLREAYAEVKAAKKSVETAHKHSTDSGVVYGCTGFAGEHLERAMKAIQEVAEELKYGK